jgi:hypothetical protein
MKTQIVDLTGDCTSCDENASLNVNLKSAKRKRDNPSPKPLESVSDNASAPPQLAKYVPRTKIRKELTQAINGAKVERLRDMLKMLCYENEDVRRIMEREFLVGEDAVIDTRKEEEESKGNGVELADDTEPSSPDEDYWRLKKRKSTRFYQAGNKLESWGSELGSELGIQDREETLGVNYLPERVGIALTDPPHRLPVCENCGETFDPEYNDEKNCVWHSG